MILALPTLRGMRSAATGGFVIKLALFCFWGHVFVMFNTRVRRRQIYNKNISRNYNKLLFQPHAQADTPVARQVVHLKNVLVHAVRACSLRCCICEHGLNDLLLGWQSEQSELLSRLLWAAEKVVTSTLQRFGALLCSRVHFMGKSQVERKLLHLH